MKISREKAALGVFALLALGGLAVLLTYIFTVGHSLNVAASSIDDATGSLDGYTAILYEGTAVERKETVTETFPTAGGDTSLSLNRQSTQSSAESASDETTATEVGSSEGESEESTSVTVAQLYRSYVEDQADVIELDVKNLQTYNERTVIRAGSHTFGIFSIDEVTAVESYFEKRVAEYEAIDVDFIVLVVSDMSLLESYKGVDIVVSAQEEGLAANGALVDGIFYDDAALTGQVGTILVSPSRTVTAKDTTSL